jgi:prepilin-type N-terminal cleavage/methylation domain-containing protein
MEAPMTNHRTSPRGRRHGFTLLELVIAIALLMIVMLMVMQMFLSAQALYRLASERSEVYSQGRVALDTIESDLQRASTSNFANVIALSQAPEWGSKVVGATFPYDPTAYSKLYLKSPDENRPDNETSGKMLPVLSFNVDSADWTDSRGELQTGPAQISYYLKYRTEVTEADGYVRQPPGAYLVRYVIPIRMTSTTPTDRSKDMGGSQTEIASSVLAVRVWAYNNAVPAYLSQQQQEFELFPRVDRVPTPSAAMMRDTAPGNGDQFLTEEERRRRREQSVLRPVDVTTNETYSWGFTAGGNVDYISSRSSFPMAIAIEITFGNEQLDTIDVSPTLKNFSGTIRTMRRVISVPNTLTLASLSDKELERFFRR